MVRANPSVSVRTVAEALGVAHTTLFPHLKAIKAQVKARKRTAAPVRTGKSKTPPMPVSIEQEPPPAPAIETM